jgi:hypothetical protein
MCGLASWYIASRRGNNPNIAHYLSCGVAIDCSLPAQAWRFLTVRSDDCQTAISKVIHGHNTRKICAIRIRSRAQYAPIRCGSRDEPDRSVPVRVQVLTFP